MADAKVMDITFQNDAKQVQKYLGIVSTRMSARYLFPMFVIYITGLLGVPALLAFLPEHATSYSDIMANYFVAISLFVMFTLSMMKLLNRYMRKNILDKHGALLAKKSFSISPNGIAVKSDVSFSSEAWAGILLIQETKEFILFYVDRSAVYAVPTTAIGDGGKIKEFLQLANAYWRVAKNPTQMPR